MNIHGMALTRARKISAFSLVPLDGNVNNGTRKYVLKVPKTGNLTMRVMTLHSAWLGMNTGFNLWIRNK